MFELEIKLVLKHDQQRFENVNFELQKQEDKFQDLVFEYNQVCKAHRVFINSSLEASKQIDSGLRINLVVNTFGILIGVYLIFR